MADAGSPGLNLTYLGTCGNQTATREVTNLLIQGGDQLLVVDAGPSVARQIYRAGHKCSDVTGIVVTHCHGDHSGGFPYLLFSVFYDRLTGSPGAEQIHVYALPEVLAGLKAALEFAYRPENWPFSVVYHPLHEGNASGFELGPIKVDTVPVRHSVPNIGLRAEVGGGSLAYSSDTVYCDEFVELAKDVDLMIHEAFTSDSRDGAFAAKGKHATALEAGRAAKASHAKELAMVHLIPTMVGNEGELVDEAKQTFSDRAFVPNELDSVTLT
jgi:ribonuclease Z